MYEAYWELTEPPFDNTPNAKFFYLSPEHEEALVRLVYTVRHRKGCGMLTGEYGCGKTTLSRALIQRLEAERYEIGLLTNPSWNAADFLREVLYQLGVETAEKHKPELLHMLNAAFYRNYQAGRDSVVIVDAAQLIEDDAVFEELRLLLNFQTAERRSEEHTSELQSQSNLVCRLLLEKKKLSYPPAPVSNIIPITGFLHPLRA